MSTEIEKPSPLLGWVHPPLFAGFFVLFFYATKQIHYSPLDNIGPVLLLTVFGTALIWGLLAAVTRKGTRCALITTLLVIAFFTPMIFEPMARFLPNLALAVEIFWGVLLFLAIIVVRRKTEPGAFGVAMGKLSLMVILLETLIIGGHICTADLALFPNLKMQDSDVDASIVAGSKKPDIYYIILDGCASPSVLKNMFDYDISPFTTLLKTNGFIVPEHSHSNYGMTELSLASFLNMSMLDSLAQTLHGREVDYSLNNRLIRDNRLASILTRNGYRYINIGSGFGPTAWCPSASENLEGSWLNETEIMTLQRTIIGLTGYNFLVNGLREIRLAEFASLKTAAHEPGPKFVLMHILLPHPPYLFDQRGGPVNPEDLQTDWSNAQTKSRQLYVDQLTYVESLIKDFLADLGSKEDSVIFIHGDHGSATSGSLYVDHPSETYIHERMGIFNAMRIPGISADTISDDITPVNHGRILFNTMFGAHYKLLPNSSLFSSYIKPFNFQNVTAELEKLGP